ncbi:MAG: glycosyltransferase [Alphaproteobacteria bacterium]|nr:glycosyltransferase [Alphaproteobacteria bacterium]
MKICYIGTAYPYRGGLASFNERLAEAFQKEGHQVTMVTFSYQYPSFLFPGKTQYSNSPAPENLKIYRWLHSINPFNWLLTAYKILQLKPDIIVLKFWLPFMGACFGSVLRLMKLFNKRLRVICILDNLIPHEKRIGDRFLTQYFAAPVDNFITMSSVVTKQYQSFPLYKPMFEAKHPLYDNFGSILDTTAARTHLSLPLEPKIILFFGFIRKYKGLDLLLKAMPIVRAECLQHNLPQPLFLVAGEYYDNAAHYSALIEQEHPYGNLILHTHFIDDDLVKYYFSASNFAIQPYRNATQSGVIPLAYHFELPMVVTNVGSLPQYVPDGKIGLVAEPNPESIADKIIAIVALGEAHFKPHFAEEKKKYSWEGLAQHILALGNNV